MVHNSIILLSVFVFFIALSFKFIVIMAHYALVISPLMISPFIVLMCMVASLKSAV